jgi:hypothetical protein
VKSLKPSRNAASRKRKKERSLVSERCRRRPLIDSLKSMPSVPNVPSRSRREKPAERRSLRRRRL